MRPILVVEDDDNIAALLSFMLEREGYAVSVAADGEAAAHAIEHEPPPALVLLDAMLPYRDGMSLLAQIRRHATWKDVPVIMLTARTLERDIVGALDAGANDYVVKPFQPHELLARVRRLAAGAAPAGSVGGVE